MNSGPRPPFHHRCRTTTVPILKSWKELGIDAREAPEPLRASMNGLVAAKTTYGDWLRTQPIGVQDEVLGPGLATLFRAGRIGVKDLTGPRLRPLSLAQIRTREGLN